MKVHLDELFAKEYLRVYAPRQIEVKDTAACGVTHKRHRLKTTHDIHKVTCLGCRNLIDRKENMQKFHEQQKAESELIDIFFGSRRINQ